MILLWLLVVAGHSVEYSGVVERCDLSSPAFRWLRHAIQGLYGFHVVALVAVLAILMVVLPGLAASLELPELVQTNLKFLRFWFSPAWIAWVSSCLGHQDIVCNRPSQLYQVISVSMLHNK